MKTLSTGNLPDGQKAQLRLHQETVWIWIRVKRGTGSSPCAWSNDDGESCVRVGIRWYLLLQAMLRVLLSILPYATGCPKVLVRAWSTHEPSTQECVCVSVCSATILLYPQRRLSWTTTSVVCVIALWPWC